MSLEQAHQELRKQGKDQQTNPDNDKGVIIEIIQKVLRNKSDRFEALQQNKIQNSR